jgi:ADP-ribose pyrophosphatase YjhB (NUDIX family)
MDYYDDPNAPAANSLVPSVNVVVSNDAGEILLIRRTDNDNWSLPGGAMDLGESLTQAGIRETKEETGVDCEITGLVGIYSDPKHVLHYTSNDEVRQEFTIVLTGYPVGGQLASSEESSEVRWVRPDDLPDYVMHASMRHRLERYASSENMPEIR